MSQADKSQLYQELKNAGVQFDRHYSQYTTEDLAALRAEILSGQERPPAATPPRAAAPVNPIAGDRAYLGDEDPIRIDDETGFIWYREEVRKPAFPKARARRKLQYIDSGAKTQTVKVGEFIETFEIAGDQNSTAEVKITMPSYQVGLYQDPRFPFKIHVYNDLKGFDLFDVHKFYGGADLVPASISRIYVANDLCYDIRSTIRAIQEEARELALKGNNR